MYAVVVVEHTIIIEVIVYLTTCIHSTMQKQEEEIEALQRQCRQLEALLHEQPQKPPSEEPQEQPQESFPTITFQVSSLFSIEAGEPGRHAVEWVFGCHSLDKCNVVECTCS